MLFPSWGSRYHYQTFAAEGLYLYTLSHGVYKPHVLHVSRFQSRGGLQAGSGLAAGNKTLGEAARS